MSVSEGRHMDEGLPDVIETGLSVLFCGINPGVRAAEVGHHFAGKGNRFWRVIYLAGFTPEQIRPEDDRSLLKYRCGLTTAVKRPTAAADEVSANEFAAATGKLEQKINKHAPRFVAFLGKAAFSAIFNQREVTWGPQAVSFGHAAVWALPNPSGRNLGFSLAELVSAYSDLRLEADRHPDHRVT